MAFRNLHQIGAFYRTPRSQNPPICLEAQETMQLVFQMSRNLPWSHGSSMTLRSAMAVELPLFSSDTRSLSTQVKAPAQARQMVQITPPKNGIHTSKPFIQISALSTPLFATLHSYSTLRSYFYWKQNQQMNRREEHFQFLGICQRLYNFITFKPMKLGPSAISDANPNEAGTERDRKVHPMTREDETREVSTVARRAEAPKKMVSINDRVEDIEEAMKLRRKSKSFEKLNWLELGRDEPRALRSILRVDSDLSGKVGTFVNSTTTRCS